MSFSIDMRAAAHRNLAAAEALHIKCQKHLKPDVAGYLYGIAAECAIKAMMREASIPSLENISSNGQSPFRAHFPQLKTLLRDCLIGRKGTPLVQFISNDSFLNNWAIDMRYSHGKDIDVKWIAAWAEQARQAVAAIGT